jgi:hypothetical protein
LQKLLIPVDYPRHLNLNSYYLDIPKVIEHFRENDFTGCIHFRSHLAEAAMYFDHDEILSSFFVDQNGSRAGEDADAALVASTRDLNYLVSIYDVQPQSIYFWANLTSAETLYKDLNSEFTDLEGLIKKMISEKLVGYIEVTLPGDQGGFIPFQNGTLLSPTYRWSGGVLVPTPKGFDTLIIKSRDSGGTFHVRRVAPESRKHKEQTVTDTLRMIEELLQLTEEAFDGNRRYQGKFPTLLKKKFLQNAERFPFLDPFLGELRYDGGTLSYSGGALPGELTRGTLESIGELVAELGVSRQLAENLSLWTKRYSTRVASAGVASFQRLIPSA